MKEKPSKNCVLEKKPRMRQIENCKNILQNIVEMIERKQSIFMAQTSFEVHRLA